MTSTEASPTPATYSERLSSDERRERLLDVARLLVVEDGVNVVTMGTVADGAGVTRALVYKHFENKHDLLLSLYRREAKRLDRMMSDAVLEAGPEFVVKLRTLIDLVIDSADENGTFFNLLRNVSNDPAARSDRRNWDRRTVRYFARLAAEEYELDEAVAKAAVAGLLPGVLTVRSRVIAGPAEREFLTDVYLAMVESGLRSLSDFPR